jgi:hypothetical protein
MEYQLSVAVDRASGVSIIEAIAVAARHAKAFGANRSNRPE